MLKITNFVLILLVILPVPLFAAEPILHFSDIVSGPKTGLGDGLGEGAIVTIWGNNLGSSQGTSKIYCNGVEASHVYYWRNADGTVPSGPADLYTYHGMQEIAFSIGATATDGLGSIYVELGGAKSNSLPFTVRSGNIYYVKTTGNDTAGDGSWDSPWAMVSSTGYGLSGATSKVSTGDIIYVGDGVQDIATYDATGTRTAGIRIYNKNATETNPIGLIAYPGARVLAQGKNYGIINHGADYWVVSKYVLKAGVITEKRGQAVDTFKGGRIIANEITNRPGECPDGYAGAISGNALGVDKVSDLKLFGNYIHDWGCAATTKFHHTIYLANRSGSKPLSEEMIVVDAFEIAWNYLKDNNAADGIQVYDENITGNGRSCGDINGTVKIHDNVVVNQRGNGIASSTDGTPDCLTNPVEIYNNLLVDAGLGPAWVSDSVTTTAINFGGAGNKSHIKVKNNTIYGYGDPTVPLTRSTGRAALFVMPAATFGGTLEFSNNLVFDKKGLDFANIGAGSEAKILAAVDNLWYSAATPTKAAPSWGTPVTAIAAVISVVTDVSFASSLSKVFSFDKTDPATPLDGSSPMEDIVGTPIPLGFSFAPEIRSISIK